MDLGAGDGRFAQWGFFARYTGYELDRSLPRGTLPRGAKILHADALRARGKFDVAVGNPPFMRVQDLTKRWRAAAQERIKKETGVDPGRSCNLYLYFLWFSVIRTKRDGLVALVVPSDWVHKPSAKPLRDLISREGWAVSTYELPPNLDFGGVIRVNAGITLIDKRRSDGAASWHRLCSNQSGLVWERAGQRLRTWPYRERRGPAFAYRGLSPGSRSVFVLRDTERRAAKISRRDVYPCIASLRPMPGNLRRLTWGGFEKYYVRPNRRCWLLRTNGRALAPSVAVHLAGAPSSVRGNATCRVRRRWYSYTPPAPPEILYSNIFRTAGRPKIVENSAQVLNLGSVHGIAGGKAVKGKRELLKFLKQLDFTSGTLPWSGGLRRVEIGQMNSLLTKYYSAASSRAMSDAKAVS